MKLLIYFWIGSWGNSFLDKKKTDMRFNNAVARKKWMHVLGGRNLWMRLCTNKKHPSRCDSHSWLNGSLEVFFVVMYLEKHIVLPSEWVSINRHPPEIKHHLSVKHDMIFFIFHFFCQSLLAPPSSSTVCYLFCWHPDILESSIKSFSFISFFPHFSRGLTLKCKYAASWI